MAIPTSLIQTYVFNGLIILIFVILGTLLLIRNQNRLAVSLAFYFFTVSIGLIINIIYRRVQIEEINILLNKWTIYITAFAGINLLNFNLLLYLSTKRYSVMKQSIVASIYGIMLAGLFFIPEGVIWQFSTEKPLGDPVYSPLFGIYGLVVSQVIFLVLYFVAAKIRRKMGKNIYSKKFFRNIVGVSLFNLQLILAFLGHMLNIDALRMVIAIVTLLCIIPGAFLLYFGLKKEPET